MEAIVWSLVLKTGWTLEYAESLSMARLRDITQIEDAWNKAKGSVLMRKK